MRLGKAVELRCYINETTKFKRVSFEALNGTVKTLVSNEEINYEFMHGSINVVNKTDYYEIRVAPFGFDTAGTYICEDDVTLMDKIGHVSNITLYVDGKI